MGPPTLFERNEAEREALRDNLNYLQAELTKHATTPLTDEEVDLFFEHAASTQKDIMENQRQIRITAPKGTSMITYVTDYNALIAQAMRIHAGFHGIKKKITPTASSSTTTTTTGVHQQSILLPRLELPKFGGNLQEWVSFRDLFINAVHNSSLSKVEKLSQLKALLTGEAARQIRSLVLSEANYDIAWKSLQDRYENNRELLFSVLRRLFTQQPVTPNNATSIRCLIDTTKECIRSLEVLAVPTQHWDAVLMYTLFTKLDPTSREHWEQTLPDTSIPDLCKMFEYLEQRARALAAGSSQQPRQAKPHDLSKGHRVMMHQTSTYTCKLGCESPHPLFKCNVFRNKTPQQRLDILKRNNLCFNCMFEGHTTSECKNQHTCKTCNRKHHTMVHVAPSSNAPTYSAREGAASSTTQSVQSHHTSAQQQTEVPVAILATVVLRVPARNGEEVTARSFIDNGSTVSLITMALVRKLKLAVSNSNISIEGLGSTPVGDSNAITRFTIKPRFESTVTYSVTALVVKQINKRMPKNKLFSDDWDHVNNIPVEQLADPEYSTPAPVEILLGGDVAWSILEFERKREGRSGQPHAIKTTLGWLVAGPHFETSSSSSTFITNADLDRSIQRFWECETIPFQDKLNEEEQLVETHFESTYRRDPSGRFIVSIPWKNPRPELGSSRPLAVQRLLALEKRLAHRTGVRDAEKLRKLSIHWETYKEFMDEYERLGHMTKLTDEELKMPPQLTYYIPHHFVVKMSSTTTKLRVVFDASMPSTSGNSLNDSMMTGPKLQDNLMEIKSRFRTYPIAWTSDLEKMYRQILLEYTDRHYQRIVWRPDPSLPISDYKLNTVTYGETASAYLAVKALQQLAKDEQTTYPLASAVILSDFYKDDNVSGCDTLWEAKQTVKELINLCGCGGFSLRKWTTNNVDLLNSIPEELRETKTLIPLKDEDTTIKLLGVYWNAAQDTYHFQIQLPQDMPGKYNKRIILSEISKIFDPCGWLSPAIIVCKIFMQELWKLKATWNEILPMEIQQQWMDLKHSLKDLEKIKIPRCVISFNPTRIVILGASDASQKAISAAVYIHCEYKDQEPSTHLFTSKTRVAPVKFVTLPRLELNGALLLSELLQTTKRTIKKPIHEVRAYTDSTITLHWINSSPARWKIYVRNRVEQIQQNCPEAKWFHLAGTANPADCASRGITSTELLHHPLWWNASSEMTRTPKASSLTLTEEQQTSLQGEMQPVEIHQITISPLHPVFTKFSRFTRFQMVTAWTIRYYQNKRRKAKGISLIQGPFSSIEVLEAHNLIIRQLQNHCFPTEIAALQEKKEISSNSKILPLRPFLCPQGLLRVGGRLKNADISYDHKHPILLPRAHHVTSSIIHDLHLRYLHAGPSSLLAIINQRYWIVRGRDAVRWNLKKCVKCTRQQAVSMKQLMGDLPPHRVNPSRPFSKVGIDYAGYFTIRPQVRSKVTLKCWLAIFVCLSTRAIYMEVVSSLSTDCFLACLRRFASRRGTPSDIFSDCGSNFKGADKTVPTRAFNGISSHPEHLISVDFGKLGWVNLTRVVGEALLTYEEMLTLVCQIEAILNSRPIVPASSDPNDLNALTPAHFLVGSSLTSVPEDNHHDTKLNRLQRWELIQQRQQFFWKRWSSEFITRMQQRPKWCRSSENLKVGQMVIVKDERLPALKWKLGRVQQVHPAADGHVRVATVRTAEGEYKRPVVKLCLLPINEPNDES